MGCVRVLALGLLEPVENAADEGANERDTSLGAGNGLAEAEEEGEVAVDAVLLLELPSSLDTVPGRGNLDKDALLLDALLLVELDEVLGLGLGGLLVKREGSVDLGRDTARDDLEDLDTELDEEAVAGKVDLLLLVVAALLLGVLDSNVNQTSVLLLLDSGEDERLQRKKNKVSYSFSRRSSCGETAATHRVGRRILGLVSVDRLEVTRVGNDCGESEDGQQLARRKERERRD